MNGKYQSAEPSVYSIHIQGKLDRKWSDWFDGMEISYMDGDTLLLGALPDQAALHGILAKIRDLGLVILEVVRQ